jgi:hypothetical protein
MILQDFATLTAFAILLFDNKIENFCSKIRCSSKQVEQVDEINWK